MYPIDYKFSDIWEFMIALYAYSEVKEGKFSHRHLFCLKLLHEATDIKVLYDIHVKRADAAWSNSS